MSFYAESIAAIIPDVEPRIVEAWMRSKYRTLDHLSAAEFRSEAREAASIARLTDAATNDAVAESYGL